MLFETNMRVIMKYIERLLNYLLRDNRLFPGRGLKQKLYNMIFGAETFTGKAFDIILMASILLSVLFTIFESMMMSDSLLRLILFYSEWFFIVFFTFEYIARVYCAPNRKEYILSFFGIIDLLSILPFYTSFFFHGAHYLPVLRVFRLIRVFRVFKLFNYLEEGNLILVALHKSMRKIMVFFMFVLVMVIAMGTVMYAVEGRVPGTQFTNIPHSIYWAIVTVTTVGYGDMAPVTSVGRFIASFVMLFGYAIIAVPTGIVSANIADTNRQHRAKKEKHNICPKCHRYCGDDPDAKFCKYCGTEFDSKIE